MGVPGAGLDLVFMHRQLKVEKDLKKVKWLLRESDEHRKESS